VDAIRGRDVEFATMRDPPTRPPSLERRLLVTAPPELVELTRIGDTEVLDRLVEVLEDPERAWAAQVGLAAMTRHEEMLVQGFSRSPEEWLRTLGPNASERWRDWLDEHRDRLAWDPETRVFVVRRA
jgi:hypothetical protein